MAEDALVEAVSRIVKEQSQIMGPVAFEQAKKVKGIEFDGQEVRVQKNQPSILADLVEQYKALFGQASVEVCKESVRGILDKLPAEQVPSSLR